MSTQADLGHKALEAKKYDDAVKYYSEALKSSNSPLWLIKRSTAYHRSGSFDLALQDAEDAIHAAISRGRRELIATGQLRRAIALMSLKRIGDARMCFTWVRKLNEKEKGLGMWQAKVKMEFDKFPEGAAESQVTVKETPEKTQKTVEKTSQTPTSTIQSNTAAAAQTSMEKIRHEWYQSSAKVTITIFAKNVPKDRVEVELGSQSLDVSFPTASGSMFNFSLLPLFAAIDVSQSSQTITQSKIEITLHKATPGQKWPALEGTESSDAAQRPAEPQTGAKISQAADSAQFSKAPAYPTSSRKGAKDWDAVAEEALKTDNKKDSKDGKGSANVDEDEADEGDALQGFFKKLYKDATPDTRRAMMKSYVESNGTALSTNWDEVGKGPVETHPPDGVEAKKWES